MLVEWEEGKLYPAYITEITKSRYRVHFDGYDSRWDDDFGLERIKGRVEGPVVPLRRRRRWRARPSPLRKRRRTRRARSTAGSRRRALQAR